MALPVMPSTHAWFRGGPGLKRVGNTPQGGGPAIFASASDEVWVWDEDTGLRVTDLLDENAQPITAPVIDGGWITGVGIPVATIIASMSIGQFGKRYELVSVQTLKNAQAALAPTDTQVQTLVNDTGSATRGAVDTVVADAVAPYPPKEFLGMVLPATLDDYAAAQAAADAADGTGKRLILSGIITTPNTLTLGKCSIDTRQLTYLYSGTGAAVEWGTQTIGQVNEFDCDLGDIVCTTKPAGASWAAGTIGLKVQNSFNCRFSFNKIENFETGLYLFASSQYGQGGIAYNKFYLGRLMNNLVNLQTELDTSGGPIQPFTNENNFYGGSFSHSDGTYPQAGMRHIRIGKASGSQNNNRFWGPSLEGGREEYLFECWGNDNTITDARWEFVATGNPTPPVYYHSTAARNIIRGGYDSGRIVPVEESGAVSNSIQSNQAWQYEAQSDGGMIVSNATGGSSSGVTVMRAAWRRQGDTTTANYMARLGPGYLRLKTQADTNDRFNLNIGLSNFITMGPGNTAGDTAFGRASAGVFGIGTASLPTPTTTTAPAAGAGDALPATPAGYVTVNINGTARKIAYY